MNSRVLICGINTQNLPKLSNKESIAMLEAIKKGDKTMRDRFIVSNMRLVLSIIKRFKTDKIHADDMFQAGTIGLIKSIDNFDLSVGVRFSTYAVPMIIGEIKRLNRTNNSLRVARSIRDRAYQILKMRSEIEAEKQVASTYEIAKRLNLKENEVNYALDAISDPISLYDPVYNNKQGDSLMLMDRIADEKNTDELWTENIALEGAIGNLNDRERKILYLRYYEGKTQTEISNQIGLSQAQVSRLEKTALTSIKKRISI